MTPKNFSESYMIHRIIIFLSVFLYVKNGFVHNRDMILQKLMTSNSHKTSNITNISNKYRAAEKDDLTSFVEVRLQL